MPPDDLKKRWGGHSGKGQLWNKNTTIGKRERALGKGETAGSRNDIHKYGDHLATIGPVTWFEREPLTAADRHYAVRGRNNVVVCVGAGRASTSATEQQTTRAEGGQRRVKKKKKALESNALGHDDVGSVAYTLRRHSSTHITVSTHTTVCHISFLFLFHRESQRPTSRRKKKQRCTLSIICLAFFFLSPDCALEKWQNCLQASSFSTKKKQETNRHATQAQ